MAGRRPLTARCTRLRYGRTSSRQPWARRCISARSQRRRERVRSALAQRLGVRLAAPDDELVRKAFAWTLRLGRAAAYDSLYLALVEELGCDLWTADRHLVRAVDLAWVRVAGVAD